MLWKRIRIGEIIKLSRMISNIPTDNLYKFCFVGSLFLLGLIVYIRTEGKKDLRDEENILAMESMKIEVEKSNFLLLKDSNIIAKNKINEAIDLLNSKKEIHSNKVDDYNSNKCLFRVVYVILGIIATSMAGLWYKRLQVYLDIIIKKQADVS